MYLQKESPFGMLNWLKNVKIILFCRYACLLKLVLEYYVIGDINKCLENMRIIEGCLEEEILRNDPLYKKVKLSLGHVVSATKAHVLYFTNEEKESKKVKKYLQAFNFRSKNKIGL